jgi:hypothetical protein
MRAAVKSNLGTEKRRSWNRLRHNIFVTNPIRKLKRRLGVKATNDPDGVMAVLQISRRLFSEGDSSVYSVLNESIPLAAPKDKALAWWAAHHALSANLPTPMSLLEFETTASEEEVLAVFDAAIKNQGTMNATRLKGKWNK